MSSIIFTIGSVTQAARLVKRAQANGVYAARMIHTPSELNKGGCSYSAEFPEDKADIMRETAQRYNIRVKKMYRVNRNESGVEYDDLSG